MRARLYCVIAMLSFAPVALAGQVLTEDACILTLGCAAHVTCSDQGECRGNACESIASCELEFASGASCARNATIAGHTCSTTQEVSTDHFAPDLSALGLQTGENEVGVALSQSEGGMNALNAPNTWTSDELDAHASLLGVQAPNTSIGLYQSTIDANSHSFSTASVFFQIGVSGAQASEYLLDGSPESCFASSDIIAHATLSCRDVRRVLP